MPVTTQTKGEAPPPVKRRKGRAEAEGKPVRIIYSFRAGSRLPNEKAEATAKRLQSLKRKRGRLTAEIVVDDAHSPGSPLHEFFEWNDTKAAEEFRLEQARNVIRSVRIEYADNGETGESHRMFVHVAMPSEEGGEDRAYYLATEALADDVLRERLIADCLADIERFKARYADILDVDAIRTKLRGLLD